MQGFIKKDNIQSFSKLSYDNEHKVVLIEDERKGYSLDTIAKFLKKKDYTKDCISSCDMFIINKSKYYFIEFKNQTTQNVNKKKLKFKILPSIMIVANCLLDNISIADLKEKSELFVVYKNEEKPNFGFDRIKKKQREIAKRDQEDILFEMADMKGEFFYDIHTIDQSEFVNNYLDKLYD